jgi:cell wall assembly regulator SMI1
LVVKAFIQSTSSEEQVSKDKITLQALHNAYEPLLNAPLAVLEVRKNRLSKEIPIELDILLSQPPEEDNLSEDEFFTSIATAGMSAHILPGPCKHIELVLYVSGHHRQEYLKALGWRLADLAMMPFRQGIFLAPNVLVRNLSLPLFEGMNSVLITNFAVGSPEWLPDIQPPIQLLSVHPVYESEADTIALIGDSEASRRFRSRRVDWDDPKRLPADLREFPVIFDFQAAKFPTETKDIEKAIQNIWKDIENWYRTNVPHFLEDLRDGVSDEHINEFEALFGVSLPEDYKASLKIHNGYVSLHDYTYLSLDVVFHKWSSMTKLSESGSFEENEVSDAGGLIQNTWWHRGWIPFAEDGGGNMICIDMMPTEAGVKGQILYMELRSGPFVSKYKSFLEWLDGYKDDLYQDVYEVDEDGFIVEK